MGKLKNLHLMNDIEVDEDALGYLIISDPAGTCMEKTLDASGGYIVHDPDCSCALLDNYQPISRAKEES